MELERLLDRSDVFCERLTKLLNRSSQFDEVRGGTLAAAALSMVSIRGLITGVSLCRRKGSPLDQCAVPGDISDLKGRRFVRDLKIHNRNEENQ